MWPVETMPPLRFITTFCQQDQGNRHEFASAQHRLDIRTDEHRTALAFGHKRLSDLFAIQERG